MRVVHLIEPGLGAGDRGLGACPFRVVAEMTRQNPVVQHDVLVLGDRHEIELAERCGINVLGAIFVPRARPMSAKRALALHLRPLEFSGDPFTVIHAWSPRAAVLAALAAPHRPRLATILEPPDRSRDARVFAGVMNRIPTLVLAASEQIRQNWSALGVPSLSMSIAPPGVVGECPDPSSRPMCRRSWNDGDDLADDTIVVGVLADRPAAVNARLAFEIVGRLALGGRDVRMIIHPRSANRAESERAARRIGLDALLIQDAAITEIWRVIPGLDVALALSDASSCSTLWACAAGVPCAIERSAWLDGLCRELPEDRRDEMALFEFSKGNVNGATALLAGWCNDSAERRSAGEVSSAFIGRAFEFQAFMDRFDQACDDALNERGLRRDAAVSAML